MNDDDSTGYFIADDKSCFPLSSEVATKWTIQSLEGKRLPDGIRITGDNNMVRNLYPLDVLYRLECNRDSGIPEFRAEQNSETVLITMKTKDACGRDILGPVPIWLKDSSLIPPLIIVLGLILLPFGIKVYRQLIVIISFVLG